MNWWMNRCSLPPLLCRLHHLLSPSLPFWAAGAPFPWLHTSRQGVCARSVCVRRCRRCKSRVGWKWRWRWRGWGPRNHAHAGECCNAGLRQTGRVAFLGPLCTIRAHGRTEGETRRARPSARQRGKKSFKSTSNQPPSVLILSLILQSETS